MARSTFSPRFFLYLAYAVMLTAVLLYVRFPAEKFKFFCEKHFEQLWAGSSCNIDRIAYQFPFSVSFQNIKLQKAVADEQVAVVVDRLTVTPKLRKFWRVFKLNGALYSGQFTAELDLDRSTDSFQLNDIQLQDLKAAELVDNLGLLDRGASGAVDFRGDYQAKTENLADATGQGMLGVGSGSMDLLQPVLSLTTIEFETIAVNVTLDNGNLLLAEGEIVGKEINADFTGELRTVSPFFNSSIRLSGHIEPADGFLRSHPKEDRAVKVLLGRYKMTVLPFKVGGTVKRPLFRFSK
jgi:type II secretion system protein N